MSERYIHRLIVTGQEEEVCRFYENNVSLDGEEALEFGRSIPEPVDIGDQSWEWRWEHWGCRFIWWASVDKNQGVLDYTFDTTDACIPWLRKVAQLYPNLKFVLYWAEPYMEYQYRHTYKNGEVIDYNTSWWKEDESQLRIIPQSDTSIDNGWVSFKKGQLLTEEMRSREETCQVEFRGGQGDQGDAVIQVEAGYGTRALDVDDLYDLWSDKERLVYEKREREEKKCRNEPVVKIGTCQDDDNSDLLPWDDLTEVANKR